MEKDDEIKGEGNSYDFGARMLDPRVGRWFAKDPKEKAFESPYVAMANNPMIYVDPDGKDNIIYLVILPSTYSKMKLSEVNQMIRETNQHLKDLGLKTKVMVYNPKKGGGKFNSNNLDTTDSFVVFGNSSEIIKEFENSPNNYNTISKFVTKEDISNEDNYELAHLNGTGLIVATDKLESLSNDLKTSKATTGSYLILHAVGHNAGMGDNSPYFGNHTDNVDENGKKVEDNNNTLVLKLGTIVKSISPNTPVRNPETGKSEIINKKIKTINDVFTPTNNPTFSKRFKEPSAFGDNTPKDHYNLNKSKIGPRKEDGSF